MKKLLLIMLVMLNFASAMYAQPYGNEWIRFSPGQPYSDQQYFKIKVWREGIYRISKSDLQSASFPLPFDPRRIQLFNLGKEQFIHVEGESDGVFDSTDYIEFYGKPNDGSFDTRLYRQPSDQLNKSFSLFTDTAVYFLTINADPNAVNRRMPDDTDLNFTGYTPIPWLLTEGFKDFRNEYVLSRIVDIKDSEYDEGEGWFMSPITSGTINPWIDIPNISQDPAAPTARVSAYLMGGNVTGMTHSITLDVGGTSETKYFTGFEVTRFNFNIQSNTAFTSNQAGFAFTVGSNVVNRTHLSNIGLVYPHTLSYSGEFGNTRKFVVPGNVSGKSFIDLSSINMTSPRLYLFSGDTVKNVAINYVGSNVQALIPTDGTDRRCMVIDTIYNSGSGFMSISPLNTDTSRFARFINYSYNPNADYLLITHPSLLAKVNDYAAYRASTGFTPLVASVSELYDQFANGIVQHPLAIRNFCEFAYDNFNLKPSYLFLVGKSVNPTRTRLTGVNNVVYTTLYWNRNLVPSFGYPCSDMLYTRFPGDTLPHPAFPVGRISAATESDVQAYLDKIISHDVQLQNCPSEWQKKILHFGGGNTGAQQDQIKGILDGFETIAEDTVMGAEVITFLKTSTDPIQVNQSQYLQALIDSGSTMMTFVAHASGTSFDISTDVPQNYHNKDRYPLILANSCFVGDIHDPNRRIAEDFILLPDKGAIGFIGQPDVGLLDYLQTYSNQLYKQIANYNYGNSVGNIMKATCDSMLASSAMNLDYVTYYIYKSILTGMTLSGDPALVLNSFDRPDFAVDNSSVSFGPSSVTSELDSFIVSVVVTNLGRSNYNPFVVHLTRHFPDGGSTYEKDTTINYIPFRDTIQFKLPLLGARAIGPNNFDIYVDYFSNADECNEMNNSALNVPLLIKSADIVPVYPHEFAIVPNGTGFMLKASTVDPFASPRNYQFQIDTVRTFSSPFLKQTLINSPGGVVKWQLPFALQPDLVYYWRVSRDSLPTDTIHPPWKECSFVHKPGISGWSQSHYSQFVKDDFDNVIFKEQVDSTFTFVTSLSSLTINNYQTLSSTVNPNYLINNVIQDYQMCTGAPSMHIAVIDSISLKPWSTDQHTFGNANTYNPVTGVGTCRSRPEYYFIFRTLIQASRDSMYDMLLNDIPNGNYVIAYSVFSGKYSQWDPSLKNLFTAMGSDSINYLTDTQPYIFFTKKGDPSFTKEAIGDSSRPAITLNALLGGNWSKGYITSVPIGPANSWSELHWNQEPLNGNSSGDSVLIDIIGVTQGGTEVQLPGFTAIPAGTYDVNLGSIDASVYPKLKLRAYVQDGVSFTPPQIDRWQIYYDEIPEFALNPSRYFSLNRDSLQEGDELRMDMAVENLSTITSDSLLVDYFLYDNAATRNNLPSIRFRPVAGGDTVITTMRLNTNGYPGLNSLWIEANPRNDQREEYHFNNIAEVRFKVGADIINPILDVTFDGVHIMNGDMVSAKPEIRIRLKDENPFLALNDTSDWQVFMKGPDGISHKLAFEPSTCSGNARDQMKWCPSTGQGNSFSIEYLPWLTADGIYELSVQASDKSGNLSGDGSYKITFEVLNKSTITEVINYPNPFSTSTRFVFTLTGSEIPDDFKIQIMTVTGRVVREINRDEIGPIRIGRNITEFAWDGRDEYNDRLANGVYLYRVLTRINGSSVEKRQSEADRFFTKGWGKMYLMR